MKEPVDFGYGVIILSRIFEEAVDDAKWLKTHEEDLVTDKFLDNWDNEYSKSGTIIITNENAKDINILLNYMILNHKNIKDIRQIYEQSGNILYFNLLEQKHSDDGDLIVEISKKLADTFDVFKTDMSKLLPYPDIPNIAETLYTINRL